MPTTTTPTTTEPPPGASPPGPEPPVAVRGPADLVEVTPYLLGFHPSDSMVLVGVPAGGGPVRATVRAGLADLRTTPGLLEYLVAVVAHAGGRGMLAVVFGPAPPGEPPELPERDLLDLVRAAGRAVGLDPLGAIYVAGGRWWSYEPCPRAACCPPAGTALRGAGSPAVAAAVAAGLTALPDRAAIGATFEPLGGAPGRAMSRAVAAAARELVEATAQAGDIGPWRAGALALLRSVLARCAGRPGGTELPWLTPRLAGRLLVALTDPPVRNVAWSWMNGDPSRWAPAEELWRQLARRAPEEPYNAPPLFLAAWAAWRRGRGAVATVALEMALAADPAYELALLMEQLMATGFSPADAGSLTGPCPLFPPRRRRRTRSRRGAAGEPTAGGEPG